MGSLRAVVCILLALTALFAQDPRGGVQGTVADSSGAHMPGVKVRAVNAETGVAAVAETNAAGSFRIPYLPAGLYRVTAESTGFKSFAHDKIEVRVGEMVDLNIKMEVGNMTETVQVTAETPVLNTDSASLGQTIDNRRIQELPQRGGNPLELALLTPGVINAGNMRLRKAMAPEATSEITADGAGRYNNEFQVDGITNMAADRGRGYGRVAFSPPQAAVREFKMQTSAYDASIGHTMGALLNVSTASGTNEYHGQLQYFLRHRILDAPNFFVNKNNTPQPTYQDHRYGVAVGGPISIPKLYNGKNRTFWFYTYEKNNFGVPVQWTRTVPTEAQRNGDFSALLRLGSTYQIYDPMTTTPTGTGQFQRTPFAGNIIPANRLDPVGRALANLYPLPNQPGTSDGRNNYFLANKALQDYYVHLLRFDHAFSENHRAFLRLHYDFWKEKKNNDFGNWLNGIHQNRPNRGVALDDVIVVNPNLIVNLRYGFTSTKWWQYRVSRGYNLASLGFSPNLLNLLDLEQAPLPRISPGAYSQISWWEDPGDGVNSSLTHSFTGTVTRLMGAHSVRIGAEARVLRSFNNRRPIGVAPDFTFETTYTRGPLNTSPAAQIGQDLASMLLGIPGGSLQVAASSALQNKFYGFYIHDDWRVTSKFTLNIGLRYELETPVTERYNRLVSDFDRTTPNPVEAQARANYASGPRIPELSMEAFSAKGGLRWVDANERSPYAGETNNIMPRIGFTYTLRPKTILRGGYGMFFDTLGILKVLPYQTGFSTSTPIQASLDNGQTYVANIANPFPRGLIQPQGPANGLRQNLGQSIDYYYRDMKQGYSQRWSFGFQQELPAQFVLDTSYVANRGTRLQVERNINVTPAEYLSRSPVRDQARIDYLGATIANPFRGTDPIYGANISRANLLKPYPQFGDIRAFEPIGYSWFHSLQIRAERRFQNGFTFQLAHTWSKTMEATEFLNVQDPTPSEVISSFDRTHRTAASGIWEIPVGRGRKFGSTLPKAVNFIVGDWQIGSVLATQSGSPLGFSNAILLGDIKDVPLERPDVDRWFNTDLFERRANMQLGNNYRQLPLRFSGVRSDKQFSLDMSFSKYFPITERVRAQFRADAYNFTNTTSFANPNTTPSNSAFGRVTGTNGDARNWQLALRFMF